MPRLSAAKRLEIQRRFAEVDTSGDHKLDFNEMKVLMQSGNANLSDAECKVMFSSVDKDRSGTIDFEEFVAYLYDAKRHIVKASQECIQKFEEFAGKEMDGTEFAKFCGDCGLLDKRFRKEDVAMTFMKVVPRGQRKITLRNGADGFSQFDKLLCLIAEKKGCAPTDVQRMVARGSKTSSATVAEMVRFHDDKTLYTGSHAANDHHDARGAKVSSPKHVRERFNIGPEGSWQHCETTFEAFDKEGFGLGNKDFVKLCDDCGIVDRHFSKGEVDVVFSKLRVKRLTFERFQEAIREVAERKKQPIKEIQRKIEKCPGPVVRATVADAVRFHDDKSLYTGMHAGK